MASTNLRRLTINEIREIKEEGFSVFTAGLIVSLVTATINVDLQLNAVIQQLGRLLQPLEEDFTHHVLLHVSDSHTK